MVNSFITLTAGGALNGFITAYLMRLFSVPRWKRAAALSAFVLPATIVVVFSIVDVIEYFERSNQYFPFTSVVLWSLLWLAVSVPVAYIGFYYGFFHQQES